MRQDKPLVIIGGGLSGALAALCLHETRPDLGILLLEAGDCFGGNHTWSFFDTDIPDRARTLVDALDPVRWPRHRIAFPQRERTFDVAYNAVTSEALDRLVRSVLPESAWRLGADVARIDPDCVTLAGGERIEAGGVIDARGPSGPMPGLELGWQKFVGIEFAATSTDPDCATIMDATIEQIDGYRFVYVLPFARDRVLVEDTYYSNGAELDADAISARVRELARQRGLLGAEVRHETGILPILIGGDPDRFWPASDPIARIGLRGGFFQATTGYSFGPALRLAVDLAQRNGEFTSAALAEWTRGRFQRHWRDMRFYRMLNRMLFHAALPDERFKVFQHFYRLPVDLVLRFYGGMPTGADKLRILSGRPPIPVMTALKAILA